MKPTVRNALTVVLLVVLSACGGGGAEAVVGTDVRDRTADAPVPTEDPPAAPVEAAEPEIDLDRILGSSEPIARSSEPELTVYVVEFSLDGSNGHETCVVTEVEHPLGDQERELGMESGGTSRGGGCGSLDEGLINLTGGGGRAHVVSVQREPGPGAITMRPVGAIDSFRGDASSSDADGHEARDVALNEYEPFRTSEGIEGFVSVTEVDPALELG